MVLGDAVTKLRRFVCNLISVQLKSNKLVQKTNLTDNLLYGCVSLSIGLNLKLAPVPYATPKWPIKPSLLSPRR